MLGGGALTVYLRQQNPPGTIVPASEGAIMGLMAGVIGALIATIISIPMTLMLGPFQEQLMERVLSNPDFPQEFRGFLEPGAMGALGIVFQMLVNLCVMSIMGLLGGLLGVAIFQKNPPPTPPPGTVEVLPPV
jgi:hypothetical protein